MALIPVNGTPLQPKIDSAQPGDILMPTAGGYAGRLKIAKSISIKGDGGVILEGGTGDGSHTVNVDVAAKAVVLSGLDLRHGSYAARFMGDCTGSIFEHNVIPVVDFMYRGTGTAQTGGNGLVFEKCQGVEARYNKISKCRAPSSQYTVDGGPFEFFEARLINVHHNEAWDCVNSGEFGKSPTGPDNADIAIDDNIFHGRANWATAPPSDLEAAKKITANGILLRALIRGSIQRNVFDLIDWWSLNFDFGGTYGGGFGELTAKDNIFRLIPGSNRMLYVKPGIALSVFAAFDGNKVFTTSGSARIAEVNGVRYYPQDLAKFRTDTGLEKTSTWTVGPLPPIVPITPPVPPPPVDPCAQVKADLVTAQTALTAASMALTAEKAKVVAVTGERDAANTALTQKKTLGGQVEALGAQIKS